jgi:hypothetical protein
MTAVICKEHAISLLAPFPVYNNYFGLSKLMRVRKFVLLTVTYTNLNHVKVKLSLCLTN